MNIEQKDYPLKKSETTGKIIISDPYESIDEFIDRIEIGDIVSGKVRMIQPYGIFIDLGPMDGLLHKSKLLNGDEDIFQELHEGREIELYIFNIDREKRTIALSQYPRKQSKIEIPKSILVPGSDKAYFVGCQLKGYSKSISDSGIHFINADGFTGFIPNRSISSDPTKIDAFKEAASNGAELLVKISNINGKNLAFLEITEYIRPNLEAYFHFKLNKDTPFDAKIIRIDKDEIFLNVDKDINAFMMRRNLPEHFTTLNLDLHKVFKVGDVLKVKSKGYSEKLLNVCME
ncbi:S1 RNA-binding domain-containing protein [Pseudomonas sp. Ps21-P2]|uniref:S1 RNA-binding domain-containing protein n=1 Tax=Pseudomonas sp. Ps21-P2 TaxID=3080331 RepID=UPI0032085DC0